MPPNETSCLRLYRKTLQKHLQQVESGRYRLHIPRLNAQWETRHKLPFHATPEIFLQIEGRMDFLLLHEKFTLRPGVAAVIPRGMSHGEQGFDGIRKPFQNVIDMFPDREFLLPFWALPSPNTITPG